MLIHNPHDINQSVANAMPMTAVPQTKIRPMHMRVKTVTATVELLLPLLPLLLSRLLIRLLLPLLLRRMTFVKCLLMHKPLEINQSVTDAMPMTSVPQTKVRPMHTGVGTVAATVELLLPLLPLLLPRLLILLLQPLLLRQ